MIAAAVIAVSAAARAEFAPGSREQTQLIIERFATRFAVVGPALAAGVEDIYAPNVAFRDPVTRLAGREAMRRYLAHFGEVAAGARFTIRETVVEPGTAVVFWTMTLADGQRTVDGVSHLRVSDRVYEERDYFDLGELYDTLPVLGWLTGLVKARLEPSEP